jgi:hypothetical protein
MILKIYRKWYATRQIKDWQMIFDLAVCEGRRDTAAKQIKYWSTVRRANQW